MHVAIIMDGNGRWATNKGLPRVMGHRRGVKTVEDIVRHAPDVGITVLTLYAFSTENWKRPPKEVDTLFRLFKFFFVQKAQELKKENVRVCFIGSRQGLAKSVVKTMDYVSELTKDCTRLTLNIAINYGGQAEILEATKALARQVAAGDIDADDINEQMFTGATHLAHCDAPDVIVRTGGDMRISNFLLWHAAYSELFFTDVLWPDFKPENLDDILASFELKERRFGGLVQKAV